MANTSHPNEPRTGNGPANNKPPQQTQTTAIELTPQRVEYLAETYDLRPPQVLVVRNAICVGANDAELEFFLATCKRLQLDPFARQIWFVKRRQRIEDSWGNDSWVDVGRPETGIDGYRTIAERTGEYEGQAPMQWCGPDGKWREVWLDDKEPPAAAKATIFRKGFREPLTNVALYREFCPLLKSGKPPHMWQRMGANQLAKCAEAGGFRRAFPRDLSGITTDTEMEAADAAASTSYQALPEKQPAQLAEKKPSVAVAATIDAVAVEKPRETQTVSAKPAIDVAAKAATITTETHADTPALIAMLRNGDEIDVQCAEMIELLVASVSRDAEEFQRVGRAVAVAKKNVAKNPEDALAVSVLDIVEPQLQKRWRELAPAQKGKRS